MNELAFDQIREELANLEHVQWANWTKYMLSNMTSENVFRWERQCETAYQNLTEREKESDRQWADKVLEVLAAYTLEDSPTSMTVLDQIAKKVDSLNKCSISTVQMAKKVYAGLEDVKQVTGNFRAEIGKFHTTAAGVTQDLKEVDHAIVSMHERIEIACSSLETKTEQILNNLVREQQKVLDTTAKQFLATLETPNPENPIYRVNAAVAGVRGLAWAGVVLGLMNFALLAYLVACSTPYK